MNDTELSEALRGLRVAPADRGFAERLQLSLENEAQQLRASRAPVVRLSRARPRMTAWAMAASFVFGVGAAAAWVRLGHPFRPAASIAPESVGPARPVATVARHPRAAAAPNPPNPQPDAPREAPPVTAPPLDAPPESDATPADTRPPPDPPRAKRLSAETRALPRPAVPDRAAVPVLPSLPAQASESRAPASPRLERVDIDPRARSAPSLPETVPDAARDRGREARDAALDRRERRELNADERRRDDARHERSRSDDGRRERSRSDDAPRGEHPARDARERGGR